MILSLGGRVLRKHHNAEAITFITTRVRPEWMRDEGFRKMLESMRNLEVHIVKSRYPIEVGNGIFVSPHDYYVESMAKDMLEKAIFIVDVVRRFLGMPSD